MKLRIAGGLRQNTIIATGNECRVSVDLMDSCKASELVLELNVSKEEAECLKLADSDWEKSLLSVFYQIRSKFGDCKIVSQAISVINELSVSCREELLNIPPSEQIKIPLAVRYWLQGEGMLKKHVMSEFSPPVTAQHSEKDSAAPGFPVSAAPGSPMSYVAQIDRGHASEIRQNEHTGSSVGNESMDLMGAEALLEETYLVLKHNIEKPEELESSSVAQVCQEKPDSASRDVIGRTEGCLDSLEWDEGFRIQISSSSGEWHVGTLE